MQRSSLYYPFLAANFLKLLELTVNLSDYSNSMYTHKFYPQMLHFYPIGSRYSLFLVINQMSIYSPLIYYICVSFPPSPMN